MPHAPIRIAMNGFGRIGRTLLRILMRDGSDFELVCINDIEPLATCAYLFQYDSVFGPWPGQVSTRDGVLIVDGHKIPFHSERDLRALDLSGVDLVLECTGMGGNRAMAERGIETSGISGSSPTRLAPPTRLPRWRGCWMRLMASSAAR
jgi:glyceraldehyde 3-phosphate dehydrogenase